MKKIVSQRLKEQAGASDSETDSEEEEEEQEPPPARAPGKKVPAAAEEQQRAKRPRRELVADGACPSMLPACQSLSHPDPMQHDNKVPGAKSASPEVARLVSVVQGPMGRSTWQGWWRRSSGRRRTS